eukprot:1159130-Pelagomonas_calceolata.AAC.18
MRRKEKETPTGRGKFLRSCELTEELVASQSSIMWTYVHTCNWMSIARSWAWPGGIPEANFPSL